MKTTIELDDALVRRAKIFAVEHGTTLRRLVEEALAVRLGQPPADGTDAAQERARHFRDALEAVHARPGMQPGADLPPGLTQTPSREEIYEERYQRTLEVIERARKASASRRSDR